MPISPDDFRAALSRFASGVTVVTTRDADGRLHGITVSAFSSVSLDPPMVLICIDRNTASHNAFAETGLFAVNVLNANQSEISERFASPIDEKFEGVDFSLNQHGLPVLTDSLANISCRVKEQIKGGDHTIFVGEIESSNVSENLPLVYFRGTYTSIGQT